MPARMVAVSDACLGSRPGTPCRFNLYASGLNSRSALDQRQDRGSIERIEAIKSWDWLFASLRRQNRCGAVPVSLSQGISGY
jgi:hypothetical protein